MPILNVQGVPGDIAESKLKDFWKSLRAIVANVTELGLIKDQVKVFFPPDLLQEGLGEEIIIEIKGLFDKPKERTNEVRNRLCEKVGCVATAFFPEALIEVLIEPPYNPDWGYWTSA